MYDFGGTSAAAPIVAGVAALVKSHCPSITRDELFDRLIDTADDVGDEDIGPRINASAAIHQEFIPTSYAAATDLFPTGSYYSGSLNDLDEDDGSHFVWKSGWSFWGEGEYKSGFAVDFFFPDHLYIDKLYVDHSGTIKIKIY